MTFPKSYHRYKAIPSAVISDGSFLIVPLWAVTTMRLNQTYHLPPIAATGARAVVTSHDDTIALSGVLVGPERFAFKLALETLAETSKRGSAMGAYTKGRLSGLILLTSMTIRTDMQIESLAFGATAGKRGTLDVEMSLAHVPLPGAFGKLLDVASVGVGVLADWFGS